MSPDERLALVALVKAVVMSDGHVSNEEVEGLADLVDELGEDDYQSLLAQVEKRLPDEPALRKFLTKVGRPEAREIIFGRIMELALADAVHPEESELLDWLADTWGLEIEFEEEEEQPPN